MTRTSDPEYMLIANFYTPLITKISMLVLSTGQLDLDKAINASYNAYLLLIEY